MEFCKTKSEHICCLELLSELISLVSKPNGIVFFHLRLSWRETDCSGWRALVIFCIFQRYPETLTLGKCFMQRFWTSSDPSSPTYERGVISKRFKVTACQIQPLFRAHNIMRNHWKNSSSFLYLMKWLKMITLAWQVEKISLAIPKLRLWLVTKSITPSFPFNIQYLSEKMILKFFKFSFIIDQS